MKRIPIGRRSAIAGAVTVTALALAGGIAYATIPDANKVFTACMLNRVGTIRLIDKSLAAANPMSRCTSLETEVSWNQQGLPGRDGNDGTGPAVAQIAAGDRSLCSGAGGAAITDASGSTAYVCNGTNGNDAQPFSGSFTSPNGNYRIDVTDAGIMLKSASPDASIKVDGGGVRIKSATSVTIEGTNGEFKAGDLLQITGAHVQLNGCGLPAARVGDLVAGGFVGPGGGSGVGETIVTGSQTVCIG